jgi:hypothetical protein
MRRGILGTPIAPAFNAVVAKFIDVPLLGNVVRRNLMMSYVGRRSGKTFTTPVNYRRVGGEVVIRVGLFPAPRTGGETSWAAVAGLRCGSTAPTEPGAPSRPPTTAVASSAPSSTCWIM